MSDHTTPTEDGGAIGTHEFDPGYSGMSVTCNALVERGGHADDCGLPRDQHRDRHRTPPESAGREHLPAEPQTISDSTGLVYCKACGFLLSSDTKGRTALAGKPCTPVRVGLRAPSEAGDA